MTVIYQQLNVVEPLAVVQHVDLAQRVVRRLPAEQIVLQHGASLGVLQQRVPVVYRPVEVPHDDATGVRPRAFQDVQDLERRPRVPSGMY